MDDLRRAPRPLAGYGAGLVGVVVLTLALVPWRTSIGRASPALALVLPVVAAGFVGGRMPALATAIAGNVAFSVGFIPPVGSLRVALWEDVAALIVFVVVAAVVGTLVAMEADRRRAAEARAEEIQAMHVRYAAVVSERERLMEETNRLAVLERIDEQRSALLRSVSHDLRTPLAAIRAVATDLRAGTVYSEETRGELLDLVSDEADRLDRFVANLLNLSRLEADALEPNRQAVPLDELVDHVVSRLARLLGSLRVEVDMPADLPLVSADYVQIEQVVTNLLENAARHSPPGGTVRVDGAPAGSFIQVQVTDQGPGVPAAQRASIFEPFQTAAGSSSTGVGLAICRGIVEAHGGVIAVDDAPGGGACFRFTLPGALSDHPTPTEVGDV